jgi:positive regulator of sigma E activity
MLALITLAGAICSLFLLSYLVRLPVTSEVRGAHIVYIFPHFHVVAATGLYLLGTCVGPLFSSHRMVQLFGMAATLSFCATYAFYATWFISVWCFFAGALSCIVLLQFHRPHALAQSSNPASAS